MKARSPLRGYNHNIRYDGRLYHVQTEDSGVQNPHVYTHLFHGGTILATKKGDYQADDEPGIVERIMQVQHKAMLKELRGGSFNAKIEQFFGPSPPPAAIEPSDSRRGTEPEGVDPVAGALDESTALPVEAPEPQPAPAVSPASAAAPVIEEDVGRTLVGVPSPFAPAAAADDTGRTLIDTQVPEALRALFARPPGSGTMLADAPVPEEARALFESSEDMGRTLSDAPGLLGLRELAGSAATQFGPAVPAPPPIPPRDPAAPDIIIPVESTAKSLPPPPHEAYRVPGFHVDTSFPRRSSLAPQVTESGDFGENVEEMELEAEDLLDLDYESYEVEEITPLPPHAPPGTDGTVPLYTARLVSPDLAERMAGDPAEAELPTAPPVEVKTDPEYRPRLSTPPVAPPAPTQQAPMLRRPRHRTLPPPGFDSLDLANTIPQRVAAVADSAVSENDLPAPPAVTVPRAPRRPQYASRPSAEGVVVARPALIIGPGAPPRVKPAPPMTPLPQLKKNQRARAPEAAANIFGEDPISETSLDEAILAYLSEDIDK